jgi:hypothetical protein
MLSAALPSELSPADVIGQDVDDVRRLAKLLFELGKLVIYLVVLFRPFPLMLLLRLNEWCVELLCHCR